MAERRMFSKCITESDAFNDMPLSTQCLYFHLGMEADDDGFISNPKRVTRMIGASDDDLRLLIAKRFILAFESGVIVIKHWKMNNQIRSDRYRPTVYTDEQAQLYLKPSRAYTMDETQGSSCKRYGIPNGNQMDTQYSIGKDSIDKNSIDKKEGNAPTPFSIPSVAEVRAYESERGYQDDALSFWNYYNSIGWTIGSTGKPMTSWKSAVVRWHNNSIGKQGSVAVSYGTDPGADWEGFDE